MAKKKRPPIKTTKQQIVDWGQTNIGAPDSMFGEEWNDDLQKYVKWGEVGYGVDADMMATHCWRCAEETKTERCHVIPHSLGGKDEPYNYRLFCNSCHLEQPNVNNYDATDKWVRDTQKDIQRIRDAGTSLKAFKDADFQKYDNIFKEVLSQCINHWGEKRLNYSTKKWAAEEIKKRLCYINDTPINKSLN